MIWPVCWMRQLAEPPIGESQRCQQRAAGMPAAIAEIGHQRETAHGEHRKDERVLEPEGGLRRERGRDEKEGREDQRLRIGDLRHAGEDIGRPEGRVSAMQRMREKSELRLKMRLGVPGDRVFAGEKRPGERERAEQENPRGGAVEPDVVACGAATGRICACHAFMPSGPENRG